MLENDTMWLRDTGVLVKMKYDVINPPMFIPLPKVWNDMPLSLDQLGIIMIVFGVGVISSIFIFFFELRKYNIKKSGVNKSHSSKEGADKGIIEQRITEQIVKAWWTGEKGMDQIEEMDEEVVSM